MIRGIISPRREVEAHQVFGQPPGAPGAGLGFQLVDQIHDVEEAAPGPIADDGPCDGNGDVGLARARPADQHDVALLVQELSTREVTHKRLVDRRAVEGELLDLAGDGQLGDGDLVFDRSCPSPAVSNRWRHAGSISLISAASRSLTTFCGSCCRRTAVAISSS